MDKMREGFEKWAEGQELSLRFSTGGNYYLFDETESAWRAWQAAQSAAVPVVGEVDKMAESISGMVMEWVTAASAHNGDWQSGLARIIRKRIERFQPTTSITAAELDALRKIESALPAIKAMLLQEREWKLENSECGGDEVMESLDRLSQAFDAAIAGEKNHG